MTINFVVHVIPLKDTEALHDTKVNATDCKCRPDRSRKQEYEKFTLQLFEHKTIRGFRKYIPGLNWDRLGLATTSVFFGYLVNSGIRDGWFASIWQLLT